MLTTIAFENVTLGQVRTYAVDQVRLVDGAKEVEEYVLADFSVVQVVRRVRPAVEIGPVAVATDGAVSWGRLWDEMLQGHEMILRVDPSDSATWLPVLPDPSHEMTYYATILGTLRRGQTLRLRAAAWYAPGSALLTALRDLIPAIDWT